MEGPREALGHLFKYVIEPCLTGAMSKALILKAYLDLRPYLHCE
jgi:hypothetical protein